jgi:hypothetical protein
MATYYVATYGNNANNGTSPSTPWLTVQFALGAASGTNPGLTAGDTVWIAPGTYREVVTSTTLTGSAGNTIKIYGDPKFTQAWTSGSMGMVRITNFLSDTVTPTGSQSLAIIGDYVEVQDLSIDGRTAGAVTLNNPADFCLFLRGGNLSVTRCTIQTGHVNRDVGIGIYCATGKKTITLDRCTVYASFPIFFYSASQTATYNLEWTMKDCYVQTSTAQFGPTVAIGAASANQCTGINIYNNTILTNGWGINFDNIGQVSGTLVVLRNNYIVAGQSIGVNNLSGSITITQTNNVIVAATNYQNITPTTNTVAAPPFDFGSSRIQAFNQFPWFAPKVGSPLISAGTATGAPSVDLYGNTWISTPTIGAIETKSESDAGNYLPTERNASAITIAPASTSQSVELYLGVTGLTFATSGLAAYYVRNQSAPVAITLVTQTATGAWTSGGFAEISSSLVPGVYRLDVPNAAFAAGASDVTIVVRGASGTNGAVLTVTLSSGGLTAAQTAAAVWDEPYTSHVTASTFGARTLKTVADNRLVNVGTANHIESNLHAVVNSTAAADELKGALLHDGISYVDTDVAQISSSTSDAVLDAAASSHNSAGSIGALIQDKTGYSLSTPQSFSTTGSVGSVTGSVASVASPDNIIDGVWDEQRTGHTTPGSFGEKLQTNALADEMLARDLGSGLNVGTAEERTVRSALRALRNKINVGSSQMVVKKEDDTTDAWTASVTTTAVSSNVSGIDPN